MCQSSLKDCKIALKGFVCEYNAVFPYFYSFLFALGRHLLRDFTILSIFNKFNCILCNLYYFLHKLFQTHFFTLFLLSYTT